MISPPPPRRFICPLTVRGQCTRHKGPSIKYVTLVFPIFTPSLCHTSSHIPEPPESTSHISDPPIFRRPSTKTQTKAPLYKFWLSCSRGFLSGGLSEGLLSGKF